MSCLDERSPVTSCSQKQLFPLVDGSSDTHGSYKLMKKGAQTHKELTELWELRNENAKLRTELEEERRASRREHARLATEASDMTDVQSQIQQLSARLDDTIHELNESNSQIRTLKAMVEETRQISHRSFRSTQGRPMDIVDAFNSHLRQLQEKPMDILDAINLRQRQEAKQEKPMDIVDAINLRQRQEAEQEVIWEQVLVAERVDIEEFQQKVAVN